MEMATFVLAVLSGVFAGGLFVGYKFRDFIGKEVKKFGDEIRAEVAKAKELEANIGRHIAE